MTLAKMLRDLPSGSHLVRTNKGYSVYLAVGGKGNKDKPSVYSAKTAKLALTSFYNQLRENI